MIKVQNANIRYLNVQYPNNTIKGRTQIMAKAGNPAVTNWYIAKKNKRKSNITLPPFSREYATT